MSTLPATKPEPALGQTSAAPPQGGAEVAPTPPATVPRQGGPRRRRPARRVAIVGGPAGSAGGGVWTVAENHAEVLAERGDAVTLLGGYLHRRPPTVSRGRLVRLHEIVPGAGLRFPWSIRFVRLAHRAVRTADVVHVHLCRDFMTCVAVLLTPRGVPIVAQTHGMVARARNPLHRVFDAVVFRRVLRRVDQFLVLTERERTDLADFGVTAPIRSIKNGLSAPARTWADPETPVGSFLGRLHPRKQPLVFVQGAARCPTDVRFLVVGDDQGELAAVRSAAADLPVDVRPGLPRAEILGTLATVSFFVLPSLDEPYPMAALEAMAVGTPMVLTEQSGISEIVRDADAALVVPPDADSVGAAMSRLSQDAELRHRLSANARALYAREWSLDAVGDQLDAAYEEVLRCAWAG